MREKIKTAFIAWRFYLLISLILLIVVSLILRMIDLAVIKQHFLRNQGDARALRVVSIPAFRGMIVDRNGYPLAISTSVYSIWANPKEFSQNTKLNALSELLQIKSEKIKLLVQHAAERKQQFVYIKRDVSPEMADKVKRLMLSGIYLQQEYKRYYPEGEVTAHVLGSTNIDDQGQEGLELAYNQWLSGAPGKKLVMKDRLGHLVSEVRLMETQKPGHDVKLSIDKRIQYIAYRELLEGVKKSEAVSGSVVVLDIKTGEILAMVNQPSFNPNNRGLAAKDSYRNRAVTDIFEPGSTLKTFSVASALESGQYTSDKIIETAPGWWRVGHNIVRDEHYKAPGLLTVAEVLQVSSNVGVSKMILSLPPEQLWNLLHRMGFGEETGIKFPGERSGVLVRRAQWSPFGLATLSFGYGLSVTPLQLAHAYATLANRGTKMPLSLIHLDKAPTGQQVIDPKVADQMLLLLESVVSTKEGTGKLARVPGYRVGGKTGTAYMAKAHGYSSHNVIASFIGIAPISHPRLVVAVIIQDPQSKNHKGAIVAGPVFQKIMEGALRIMNIPPDDTRSLKTELFPASILENSD